MSRTVVVVCVSLTLTTLPVLSQPAPSMTAHFIDVDQAHATLLEFSCGAVLVDVGSQDDASADDLVNYLNEFFKRRNDLSRTLNSILITHNHIDHTRVLRRLIETEKMVVEHYVDNGFTTGSGRFGPNWLKEEVQAGRLNTRIRTVPDSDVEAVADKSGLTDADIDPIACMDENPRIRVLQGSFDENPGWNDGDFENQNNHSLVARVDFGSAEFLFMGDLQEAGIELLLDYYAGPARAMLNADVLQVGHHGSHNATTANLLAAVTPSVAVIPVGPSIGQDQNGFNAFVFGHPRSAIVDLLINSISRQRTPSKTVRVATGQRRFRNKTITRAVYATGWDGTVRVVARSTGALTVFREH
jgi:beta-lactamase superfamily II metal-dependent hydrolase